MAPTTPGNLSLIRNVLGEAYLQLDIVQLEMSEDPQKGETKVRVTVKEGANQITVEGLGVGIVDALYNGCLARYAREYQSLNSIVLAGFSVASVADSKRAGVGTDAKCTVTIDVTNSEGRVFTFQDQSRSVTASATRAALRVVEHFVNSERAFVTLHNARKDALARGRSDLVTRFTQELSEVVKSTSYTEVIEKMQRELGA